MPKRMSTSLITQAAFIIGISVAGAAYLGLKGKQIDAAAASASVNAEPKIEKAAYKPEHTRPRSASVVSIPRRDGHFFTYGKVNRGSIEFLVDTGATVVALTQNDARKAGIVLQDLNYTVPIQTAGGTIYAASVSLDTVAIGGINVRNVQAVVVREGLSQSLLGMSFLGQLQKVEVTPSAMMLRR